MRNEVFYYLCEIFLREKTMQYFDYIIGHYGWAGTTLIALMIVMFLIQLFYYLSVYGKVVKYRNSKRKKRLNYAPPISVLVPLFSEDYGFIRQRLPRILGQHYESSFEVVVVFVGTTDDFYEELETMRLQYPTLRITHIQYNPRFPIPAKLALNIAIKSAFNEHIILTTTAAAPATENWLSMMGKGFMRGEVILGYTAIEQLEGWSNHIIRMSRLQTSMYWLAKAVDKCTYSSSRCNLGLTKSLYFESNGFSHLNMNIGENDLFVQKVATRKNVSVVMTPKATVVERQWGGLGWWMTQLKYYGSAFHLYPQKVRDSIEWDLRSQGLLFVTALATMIFMPLEMKLLAVILLLTRIAVVISRVRAIANRLGEKGIALRYVVFDMINPLLMLYLRIKLIHKDRAAWR